jgi:hypothetical protein
MATILIDRKVVEQDGAVRSVPAWSEPLVQAYAAAQVAQALPPARKPLTVEQINAMPEAQWWQAGTRGRAANLIRAVERAHEITE